MRHLKAHILWAHQSYDQPSVQNLAEREVIDAVDVFVFVSEWQRAHYLIHFPIPAEKTIVIRNAIEPIPVHDKPQGKLRLVYTSTPFRGLDVLLDAIALLDRSDIELHIYSGMSLYARPWEDAQFEPLYARARSMPNVFYHGAVSNAEVRAALAGAHIFAYPSTWEETSCLALIEAMSAGCRAVTPALGALPETAAGFAQLYPAIADNKEHAAAFACELGEAIDAFWTPLSQQSLALQKAFFDQHYSWDARIGEWEALLYSLSRKLPAPAARV
ncbi:MAG TPA: glycosyltransferase family 4 protein [Candidatus Paceibacterota bacterium]|nr:glycosyltransferase family 4 protein [Candidatus Paceibacterota bacterium]